MASKEFPKQSSSLSISTLDLILNLGNSEENVKLASLSTDYKIKCNNDNEIINYFNRLSINNALKILILIFSKINKDDTIKLHSRVIFNYIYRLYDMLCQILKNDYKIESTLLPGLRELSNELKATSSNTYVTKFILNYIHKKPSDDLNEEVYIQAAWFHHYTHIADDVLKGKQKQVYD